MSDPVLRKAKSSPSVLKSGTIGPKSHAEPTSSAVRYVEVDAGHEGQRLDNFLIRECKGVPKSHLYKAIRGGQVRVNKGRVQVDHRLQVGDVVRVPPFRVADVPVRFVPATEFPLVYEDDALLVINKPEGVAVHGGSGVDFGVIEQLRAARPEARFLELVHRLDRDTSGLLVVAKKRSALVALHASMREGVWEKHYALIVKGDWVNDRQHVRRPLFKWTTKSGERRVRVDEQQGLAAHTIFSLVQRLGEFSVLNAQLKTGRTHQIRVHASSLGFPLVGDDKYGDEALNQSMLQQGHRRMFLHARRLAFPHPLTHEVLAFETELPVAFQRLIQDFKQR